MSVHNRIYEARSRSWIWLDTSTSYAIIVIETYEHQGWEKSIGKFLYLRSTAMFQSKIHNSPICVRNLSILKTIFELLNFYVQSKNWLIVSHFHRNDKQNFLKEVVSEM